MTQSHPRLLPSPPPDIRHPLPALTLHLYSLILLPLLHHLWLGAGSGNANFFYASTLVFGLGNALFVADLVVAGKRVRFNLEGAKESVKRAEAAGGEGEEQEKEQWEVVQVSG